MQALDFREDMQLSDKMSKIKNEYREIVKFIEKDKMLSEEIVKSVEFIKMNRYGLLLQCREILARILDELENAT